MAKAKHPFRQTFRNIADVPTMYGKPFRAKQKKRKISIKSLNSSKNQMKHVINKKK